MNPQVAHRMAEALAWCVGVVDVLAELRGMHRKKNTGDAHLHVVRVSQLRDLIPLELKLAYS